MKKLCFSLLACFLAYTSFADYYPISPRPLRKLVMESEYIIRGYVEKLDRLPECKKKDKNCQDWDRDFAVVKVTEVWQGELTEKAITVFYSANLICPTPAHFMENTECIIFLDKEEKRTGFSVHALSYGVKNGLQEEDFGLYKTRVNEMQSILNIKDTREQDNQTLEWLVRCAEHQATRYEGVYELIPESNFMSYYDREVRVRKDIYLDKGQINRLYNALLNSDGIGYYELGLIDIVRGIDDAKILEKLKEGLIKRDTTYIWTVGDLMNRIVDFTHDPELSDLTRKFNEITGYDDKADENRRKIYMLFIGAMKKSEYKPVVKAVGNTG